MKKEIAKDIAISLIAKSGYYFDSFAFDDCSISESDKDKIMNEIMISCENVFDKIQKKYKIKLLHNTNEIVHGILNASKRKK